MLKEWHAFKFGVKAVGGAQVTNTPVQRAAKEEYYRLAGQFLHSHSFPSALEREIWALHSDGMSIRHIVAKLKKKYWRSGLYRNKVHGIIQQLSKTMLLEAAVNEQD